MSQFSNIHFFFLIIKFNEPRKTIYTFYFLFFNGDMKKKNNYIELIGIDVTLDHCLKIDVVFSNLLLIYIYIYMNKT